MGSSDYRFTLENQVGNVLSALFGAEGSGSLAGKSLAVTDAEGASSAAAPTTLLSDLGLSGKIQINSIYDPPGTSTTIELEGTVADLVEELNTVFGGTSEVPKAVFDTETARIQILGIEVPTEIVGLDETGALTLESIFGHSKVDLKTEGVTTTITKEGLNAQLTVNGINIERAGNSFTLDGLTIDLLKKTDGSEPITLDTTRNTDKIVEGVKKFIDEYNGLLDKLNGLVDAEATYKKYPPLTAEQKKEMSENEIKLWEEKAQEGLLRKDENITRALSKMRTALYSKPEGGKYALYDLGIETGSWAEKGKLHIKEPPTALLEALASNPQDIEKLFTDATTGLATQVGNIIDETAKVSSGSPGSLVKLAGAASLVDKNSTIGRQMDGIDELLERLQATYDNEKERYWNEFNTMEQLISQMNQQSSWLASQFAG
jgi:flagellar capping protein FliD